ncbi:hypothetical protein CEQ90_18390 [Lewinellaceae bacterium SD302]|nr:hypothetical protein CEQ90_18390 [Lewinellaceae bacterium SD302]
MTNSHNDGEKSKVLDYNWNVLLELHFRSGLLFCRILLIGLDQGKGGNVIYKRSKFRSQIIIMSVILLRSTHVQVNGRGGILFIFTC